MSTSLLQLAMELGIALKKKNYKLATAESCTGGGLAYWITNIPGSSEWFEGGFITYSNLAKQEMLGINPETLKQFGAVSKETAIAMGEKVLSKTNANLSIAITGVAGPSGGSSKNPVGSVWIAWAGIPSETIAMHYSFQGNRTEIREQAIINAMTQLLYLLKKEPSELI